MKERVIVFDGEDKFISAKGNSEDSQLSPEGARFKKYMLNQSTPVVIPNPSDSDFCEKAELFIKTNCGGKATPQQVWDVHELFQKYCLKKGEKESPSDEKNKEEIKSDNDLKFPDWNNIDCDTIAKEIKRLEDILLTARLPMDVLAQYKSAIDDGKNVQAKKCTLETPTMPSDPEATSSFPSFVSLSNPNLGIPPGVKEKKEIPLIDKKSNNNYLVIAAIALIGAYFIISKNNKS